MKKRFLHAFGRLCEELPHFHKKYNMWKSRLSHSPALILIAFCWHLRPVAERRQLSSHCLQRGQAQQRYGNAQRHPDHPRVSLGPRSRVSVSGVDFLSSEPVRDGTFYGFAVSQTSHLVLWRLRLALAVKQTVAAPRLLPEDDALRRGVKRRARALKWEVAAVEHFAAPVAPLPCLRKIYAERLLQFVALAKAIDLSRRVEPPFLAVLAGVDTHSTMKLRLLDFKTHF